MAVSYPLEFTQASVPSGILATLFVDDFSALAIRQRPSWTVFFEPIREATRRVGQRTPAIFLRLKDLN
jgi:hypothetical protein